MPDPTASSVVLETDAALFRRREDARRGPEGSLPITPEMLLTQPSGNLFGLTQNAGMGWDPARLLDPEFLILSTHGGCAPRMERPSRSASIPGTGRLGCWWPRLRASCASRRAIPFAGACTDPCDGRTQGTDGHAGLAALPQRCGHGAAPADALAASAQRRDRHRDMRQGLPAMMMALASAAPLPSVLVPGGVTLLPESGEDAGKVQTIGARFAQGRSRWSTRPRWAAAPARLRAEAASFSAPRPRRRSWRKRSDFRCRTPRLRLRASRSGWTRHALRACAAAPGADRTGHARHPHGRRGPQRDGAARGVWRLDESAAACSGHCARGGSAPADASRTGRT